ncbi:CaiB/BaiF CoA-transferase family protein [Falsiroseomonas sp.]|uniref:CaiB/BaiF CoA transferase family protein n=1 Tax=Falsiroseomonas sp. TaxID=2870721 RepID=UPI002720559C|nr:CoA transferase [Falsiroseomonas sp.]MDO9502017.1 CoA transferase [Falsiroseomonas sp.]
MAGVLDGVRVLDLSRVFAGPAATQILGDLGAEVTKVEEPGRGDEARGFGVTAEVLERLGASPSFLALNRNKRSIALDLKSPAGLALARRLAAASDVLVHNFRPGAMEKWGLGWEDLRAVNPRLIHCGFSAYGEAGPLRDFGANDVALQAHSGLMHLTGEPDRPPVRVGTAGIDLHGSLGMVSAILAALLHRAKTGEGQKVTSSLLQSSAHLMSYFYTDWWLARTEHRRMGTANHLTVPNQVFPAADGDVVIIAPSDDMWRRLARALDPARLERPEYLTAMDRRTNRAALLATLTEVTSALTCDEILRRLGAAKVNVARVHDVGQAADHPQLEAAGAVLHWERDGHVEHGVAPPFTLTATPVEVRRPPPMVGEHTAEILREIGLGDQDLVQAREEGAFGKAG